MRVAILGPLEVTTSEGDVVAVGGARLRSLLVRLVLDAGRSVTVESLTGALWADEVPENPVQSVHSLVSRLRRAIPDPALLRSGSGWYRLDLSPDAVDAVQFESLIGEGRNALRDGETDVAEELLRKALGLWRGDALADVPATPYVISTAARLRELRLSAVEDSIEAALAANSGLPRLAAELTKLSAGQPLRERPRALLMRALRADGRRSEALAVYEEFRKLLADNLGTDPGPELRRIHLSMLREDEEAQRRPAGNLRASLTSFVGREAELDRIGGQLAAGRLVTLVGPGGVGKTRLAVTAAAGLATRMSGGVWLVDLAAATVTGDVLRAAVSTICPREGGLPKTSRVPMARLVEALGAGPALVVWDNCEHVLDEAANLVDELLGRCPQLRVLATSREPLGMFGEALCPVAPFAVPDPGAPTFDNPAVRLFADRAAAVCPGFAVTAGNVGEVTGICRKVDGLPLAIELAAARLRAMSLKQLCERLDDRFQVLTEGSRVGLARHRTLRAVVAWSWDLLDDAERACAARLAVFPASFPSAAAEHLGVPWQTLAGLVDKSLIQLVDGRYRMLETVRAYGLERLAEAGQVAAARRAHGEYFLDLAERAAPALRSAGQLPWLGALTAERDNLLAAAQFAAETGDAETAVRLAAALGLFWAIQEGHAEAADRIRAALDVPGSAPAEVRITATADYLFNAVLAGQTTPARGITDRLPPGSPEQPRTAMVDALLSLIAGDPAGGLAALNQCAPIADPWMRGTICLVRSMLHGGCGDLAGMRQALVDAAAGFRESGERWGLTMALTYLGAARNLLGECDHAAAALNEARGLVRELKVDDHFQRVLLAVVRLDAGEVDIARAELLDIVADGAVGPRLAMARIYLADLARWEGDPDEAARQLDSAAAALGSAGQEDALLRCGQGFLAIVTNDLVSARRHLATGLRLAAEMPDPPLVARVGVGVAQLVLRRGDAVAAAELLGAAHALRSVPDVFNRDVARLTSVLREGLGEDAYLGAYGHGQRLTHEKALALIHARLS